MGIFLSLLSNRYVVGAVIITTVIGGLYLKYTLMTNEIENLKNLQQANKLVIEEQVKTIESLKVDYEKIIKSKKEIEEENKVLIKSNKELEEKLYRENQGKKSLEELAKSKPTLVEKIINDATEDVFTCFEDISLGEQCK